MKIVVEGFDGTGKSTVVEALVETLGLPVLAAGPAPPSDSLAIIDSLVQLFEEPVIHDRITPISRLAYQLDLSVGHRAEMQEILKFFKINSIFVFCVNTDNDENHKVKDYDTPSHLRHISENKGIICENYERLFANIVHFRYDFRLTSTEELVCGIKKMLNVS